MSPKVHSIKRWKSKKKKKPLGCQKKEKRKKKKKPVRLKNQKGGLGRS